jgi:spore maturation protein CgeB
MKVLLLSPKSDFSSQMDDALQARGDSVLFVDDRVDYGLPKFLRSWRWLWRFGRRMPFLRRRSNMALQRHVLNLALREHVDVLLATKGMNIKLPTLESLRRLKVRTAVWFPDNAANEPYASWVRTVGPAWDHFFSFDSAVFDQIPGMSRDRLHVLPFGIDPNKFQTGSLTTDDENIHACNVVFVGAPYPDRVRLLESIADLKLNIWGWSGWTKTSLARHYHGPLDARGSAKAYRLAKISLNTNVLPRARGVNLKTFEICAAGGFQLTDNPTDLGGLFEIDRELAVFGGEGDFRAKILEWLAKSKERADIAAAGKRRVIEDHSMAMRINELMSYLA